MKKSIFIKENKYYYCDYTNKLPHHIIFCEILGLSVERLFENEISVMDIYVDLNSNLKKFYEYLENDRKRKKIKQALNGIDSDKLNHIEFADVCDKEICDVLTLYKKCVEVIKSKWESEYINFFSKRNERYVDKDSFSFSSGFKQNKKYLIPIVDRLNEIQVHKILKNEDIIKQALEIVKLYDDFETLFSFDIKTFKEFYEFCEVDFINMLIKNEIKGITHIICDEVQLKQIIYLLKEYNFDENILINSNDCGRSEYKLDDEVTLFKVSPKQYRISQIYGRIKNIEGNKVWVDTDNNKQILIDIPTRCLIKTKKYNPKSPIESPINWYGGKYYLANDIINIFPGEVKTYVEVFGGAGHILFKKELASQRNIYNDLNIGLATFFKLLSDNNKKNKLMNKLTLTPYHQEVWEESETWINEGDDVELARKFYIRTMQSRSSNGGWSFTRDKKYSRRNMAASVSRWLGNIENNIHRSISKLSKVVVENNSFEACIEKHDSEDTLFYLDPPYVPDTRTFKKGYLYEMSVEQHEQLVDILLKVKGKVVLSGYDNDIYSRLEREGNFTRILIKEVVKSSVNINREELTAKEYVWVNFEIENSKLINYLLREILTVNTLNESVKIADIRMLQEELNYILPRDYYNFLYIHNGGEIRREVIDILCADTNIPILKVLYSCVGCENQKLIKKIDNMYITIGEDENGNLICISTDNNKIYLKYNDNYVKIAESFSYLIKEYFNSYKRSRILGCL